VTHESGSSFTDLRVHRPDSGASAPGASVVHGSAFSIACPLAVVQPQIIKRSESYGGASIYQNKARKRRYGWRLAEGKGTKGANEAAPPGLLAYTLPL